MSRTTARLRPAIILLAALAVGLTGCSLFAPEGGDPPGNTTGGYKERTTCPNVIHNLIRSYEEMESQEYIDLLSDDFEFWLNPTDVNDPGSTLPDYWGKTEESAIAHNMLDEGSNVESISLTLTQIGTEQVVPGPNPEDPTGWSYVYQVDLYVQLQVGAYALDLDFLVPGLVESLDPASGLLEVRFDDRHNQYGVDTVHKLLPRPADFFPALVLYNPERLRTVAGDDPAEFVKMALRSHREGKLAYKDLKSTVTGLLGEKGWKDWWQQAKRELKRDAIIAMSGGSQPSFRLMRQADRYEDRLRREFDFRKDPLEKLLKVMTYLDEVSREEKQGACENCADEELLIHFGNGAAKVAVSVLQDNPSLALAGLALHAEIAARGTRVAKPNPKAGAAVLAKITDAGELVSALPESLLQRVMAYIRRTMPERWGEVWAVVLLRAGKRLCDSITRGLIEGGQKQALENALLKAVAKPTSSPDLLGWLWRTMHSSTAAAQFLAGLDSLPVSVVAEAMFSLLDSQGKLYGMSMEEKHLKLLESARIALATQNNKPLLGLIDSADRAYATRLKTIIESNHGLAPSVRTQLLGYLRSRFADIFIEVTREWEDSKSVYTTEAGLRITQEALQHIKDVEIPQVAKQIREAASFGDLSENAEYTAALEKRDQIFSRANILEADLNRAVVITAEMAASDFVNAGTRVTARSLETGQEEVKRFIKEELKDKYADEKLIINYISRMTRNYDPQKIEEKFPDMDLIIVVADEKKIKELLKTKQLSDDELEGTYVQEELSPSVRITLRE